MVEGLIVEVTVISPKPPFSVRTGYTEQQCLFTTDIAAGRKSFLSGWLLLKRRKLFQNDNIFTVQKDFGGLDFESSLLHKSSLMLNLDQAVLVFALLEAHFKLQV